MDSTAQPQNAFRNPVEKRKGKNSCRPYRPGVIMIDRPDGGFSLLHVLVVLIVFIVFVVLVALIILFLLFVQG